MNRQSIIDQHINQNGTDVVDIKKFNLIKLQQKVAEDLYRAGVFSVELEPLPVELRRTKKVAAFVRTRVKKVSRYSKIFTPLKMGFSVMKQWSISDLLNVTAHEQIHQYTRGVLQWANKNAHGDRFLHYMNLINKKTDYVVTVTDDEFTLHDDYVKKVGGLIFEFKNGELTTCAITDKIFNQLQGLLRKRSFTKNFKMILELLSQYKEQTVIDSQFKTIPTIKSNARQRTFSDKSKRDAEDYILLASLVLIILSYRDLSNVYLIHHNNKEYNYTLKRKLWSGDKEYRGAVSIYNLKKPLSDFTDSIVDSILHADKIIERIANENDINVK